MPLKFSPCCCGTAVDCGNSLLLTMSGVVDGSCADCEAQYNDSILMGSGVASGSCDGCGVEVDSVHCAYTFGQDTNPCFADDNDSLVCFYTGTDSKKYVSVKLEDETLGGFGETFAIWQKEITEFTLPQTLTSADECYMAHAKCDFSAVVITLEAP